MSEKEVERRTDNLAQDVHRPHRVTRRALLKNSAVSMPAILTLHSGAALARSSNLIGPANYDAKDRLGRTLCLDLNSVDSVSNAAHIYDLGDPSYAHVYAVNDRKYFLEPDGNSYSIGASAACESDKTVYYRDREYWNDYERNSYDGDQFYRDRNWKKVRMHGMVVSATALSSFAGSINVTDI